MALEEEMDMVVTINTLVIAMVVTQIIVVVPIHMEIVIKAIKMVKMETDKVHITVDPEMVDIQAIIRNLETENSMKMALKAIEKWALSIQRKIEKSSIQINLLLAFDSQLFFNGFF